MFPRQCDFTAYGVTLHSTLTLRNRYGYFLIWNHEDLEITFSMDFLWTKAWWKSVCAKPIYIYAIYWLHILKITLLLRNFIQWVLVTFSLLPSTLPRSTLTFTSLPILCIHPQSNQGQLVLLKSSWMCGLSVERSWLSRGDTLEKPGSFSAANNCQ